MTQNKLFRNFIVIVTAVIMMFSLTACGIFDLGSGDSDKSIPAVYIMQEDITIAVGDTIQLKAVSTTDESVVWDSSQEDIATVSDSGMVTAVSVGSVIIMASTPSVMATCNIKVVAAPVDNTEGTGNGDNNNGNNGNEDDPSDDDNGNNNGGSGSDNNDGSNEGESNEGSGSTTNETLVLSIVDFSLEVGSSVTLKATYSNTDAQAVWSSTNTAVATVSRLGKVTAVAVGSSTISVSVGTLTATCTVVVTAQAEPNGSYKSGYNLVWYDEFEGTTLDRTKWNYQTGIRDVYHDYDTQNWNWGNGELQYYTEDSVSVSGGSLVITATKQTTEGMSYKSGRILTRDLASWTYGYFEAKIKTPTGNGMWPAFWMLPQPSSYSNVTNVYGGWPYNGEIDIMEAKGRLLNQIDTTLHYGPINTDTWQSMYTTKVTTLSSNTDQWHTYAVEWTSSYIAWIVDGTETMRVTSAMWYTLSSVSQAQNNASAPFDQPFYILLNLAVGGGYDGGVAPDDSFTSASMYVDYVRVYEKV